MASPSSAPTLLYAVRCSVEIGRSTDALNFDPPATLNAKMPASMLSQLGGLKPSGRGGRVPNGRNLVLQWPSSIALAPTSGLTSTELNGAADPTQDPPRGKLRISSRIS